MGYVVICAPAGVGLGNGVQRLRVAAGSSEQEHRDVEDILCRSYEARKALESVDVRKPEVDDRWPTMKNITWDLSRNKVIELWRNAAREAVLQLKDNGGRQLNFLSCHLTLYGGKRSEVYSAMDVDSLSMEGFKPSHVLLLIDDIYDVYYRLTCERQLFFKEDRVADYLAEMWDDEGYTGEVQFGNSVKGWLALEWQIGIMSTLLSWRHSDILLAESLAKQIGAKFLIYSVKQPVAVALEWLRNLEPRSVYLSHPISRPRRDKRRDRRHRWPEVVFQFNGIQEKLLPLGLASIMPTGIDEYRIARKTRGKRPLSLRTPKLEERWPVPQGLGESLYAKPENSLDMNHPDLFLSTGVRSSNYNIYLRALENQIGSQVSARDHFLVSHNIYFLVFRPLYSSGKFSEGVRAEIEHCNKLAKGNSERRCAFIHFLADVDKFVAYVRSDNKKKTRFIEELRRATIVSLTKKSGRPEDEVTKFVDGQKTSSLLDRGSPDSLEVIHNEVVTEEKIRRWRESLTGMYSELADRVGVSVLPDAADLDRSFGEIASFLKGEIASPSAWINQVVNIVI